jgi:hypothetical protein
MLRLSTRSKLYMYAARAKLVLLQCHSCSFPLPILLWWLNRWMAAARDGQLSDGTTVDSRLLTVGSADGCPSSGGGAPCSTPGQPHPSSSGSNGGGVRHGSHGALLTTSVSSMHLSVASANVPRHKPPALDLDRTRVRKDAQLFLSSITFSGTHPHSRVCCVCVSVNICGFTGLVVNLGMFVLLHGDHTHLFDHTLSRASSSGS